MATNDGSGPPAAKDEANDGTHAMRRAGGARINASRRVKLVTDGKEHDGWLLNISRGGVRMIVEEEIAVGEIYAVRIGEDDEPDMIRRPGRVVWVQEEPDGAIIGIEYTDRSSSATMPTVPEAPDTEVVPVDPEHK